MKNTKKKGYPNKNGIFEKIIQLKIQKIHQKFSKKSPIGENLKATPQKEVDINLDTLANQTKYSTAIKCLLNNI